MTSVAIQGQGVAARCCAWLLDRAGTPVSMAEQGPARVPALVISQATGRLLADVFEQPNLFAGLPRIARRIVAWGRGVEPVSLPHSAVVLSEEALLARLRAVRSTAASAADWTVFASGGPPAAALEQHFGARRASAVSVEMAAPDASACWVESLEAGWLFLIPGWLIAIGAAPEELLSRSRLVAGQVRAIHSAAAAFPAYPRIADPLGAPGWLACGSSAMAFDPICGDGTGNAVREAILAAAVIRSARSGEPVDALLGHYRARLIGAFQRHLELCLQFYRSANAGAWWQEEVDALERGAAWCASRLAPATAFRYRLDGFDLLPVSAG